MSLRCGCHRECGSGDDADDDDNVVSGGDGGSGGRVLTTPKENDKVGEEGDNSREGEAGEGEVWGGAERIAEEGKWQEERGDKPEKVVAEVPRTGIKQRLKQRVQVVRTGIKERRNSLFDW
jgi:hypothetical protein